MKRVVARLEDIAIAIEQIDGILDGMQIDDLTKDVIKQAAFERFLEIISEASRHIPDELKETEPTIPWNRVAGIGNHLRHAYHKVDAGILWQLWANHDLAELGQAVARMVDRLKTD